MAHFSDEFVLEEIDSSEVTIRRALNVREQTWFQVIDQDTFRIPEYQRNYSWEDVHRADFWSVLEETFTDLHPLPDDLSNLSESIGLYMGGIYVAVPGEDDRHNNLDIIDGQQRLATFQLLLKALNDYCISLKNKADEEDEIDLKAKLSSLKSELDAAYQGNEPSIAMNSEDRQFFAALAAYPDSWQVSVRDILSEKVEEAEDLDLTGRMRPRVKTVEELINMIQGPLQTGGAFDLKDEQPFAEGAEEGEEDSESKLDEFIRFETSHERMFDAYEEAYGLIKKLFDDETNGSLEERANLLLNFSSFIVHTIVVDRCLITESNPDLRLDIFQSINDKGRPLHNVDKIRARIKHRLIGEDDSGPMDEWRDTLARHGGDKDEIEDMLVYFVASIEKNVDDVGDARKELMNVFDRKVSGNSNVEARLTSENAPELVSDVAEYSKYYQDIRNGELSHFSRSISEDKRQELKRMFTRVGDKIGASQWYALGPWVYMQTDKNAPPGWNEDQIGEFLFNVFDAIEVVVLRQSISERSGEAVEGSFVDTVQKFQNRDDSEQFKSSLIVSNLAETVRDKAGDLFEDGLIDHFVKNRDWTSGSTAQCVLHRTTSRYLADSDIGLAIRDYSHIQIEHIFPQSPISSRSDRTFADSVPGDHAWLESFFQTVKPEAESPLITEAAQLLIEEDIESLKNSDIDEDELSEDVDPEELERIQAEIYSRFVDDIGNLLLLVNKDNIENSNDLMSRKLPVYTRDEYFPVIVNDFFNEGENSEFAVSDSVRMEYDDFEALAGTDDEPDWDPDAAERVDESWNYEVMFDRKEHLIKNILKYLTFNLSLNEDEDDPGESSIPSRTEFEDMEDRVADAVEADMDRRIGRRAF